MQLVKYKVNKFRSVKDTDWIDIDQWACFVGTNESGKTNLLLPLWKFNPADDSTSIHLLHDYPRDEYSKSDREKKATIFIEVLFRLDTDEIEEFNAQFMKYKSVASESDHAEEEIDDENGAEDDASEASDEVAAEFAFSNYLLIKRNFSGVYHIFNSNQGCDKLGNEIENTIGKKMFNWVVNRIPKFLYYSDYGNLDSDLYLPEVKEDLDEIDELSGKKREKARTLKVLFSHLGLNTDEIIELGQGAAPEDEESKEEQSHNRKDRQAQLYSAATRLTTQFRQWWSQGEYTFEFSVDGDYFQILVSDRDRPAPIDLEMRSRGLQWFFSFFLVFLAEREDSHYGCILLLDEPGLNLHPNSQYDLIKFFKQLAEDNQLIYTTHLPFLVDHDNLDKVKAVFPENGVTQITNDLNKADKEGKAIQPVNAAIGITASQSLLIGCQIVIVEGISDQHYLSMIKNHLTEKGKFKAKKEMVFMPVGGAKGVKPVVSIIHGVDSDLPVCFLDSDEAGRQYQNALKQGLYADKGEQKKILEADMFTGKAESEVEDLMPVELIIDSFDRVFRPQNEIEAIDDSQPIIPQLKKFAKEQGIKLELGWKVEISKKTKQRFQPDNVDDETLNKWEALFKKLQ